MNNLEAEKWNKVYQAQAKDLPWFGIPFSPGVTEYLNSLSKDESLIVTGVGVGDTANVLYSQGFRNITGTDLSSVAIETASKRFPKITFKNVPTQDLAAASDLKNSNVLDWLNLHQISPADLGDYLKSLAGISKNLCIAWITIFDGQTAAKSQMHQGNIYFHNPELVKAELEKNGMKLQKQFDFKFQTNPHAKIKMMTHDAVGQIYGK